MLCGLLWGFFYHIDIELHQFHPPYTLDYLNILSVKFYHIEHGVSVLSYLGQHQALQLVVDACSWLKCWILKWGMLQQYIVLLGVAVMKVVGDIANLVADSKAPNIQPVLMFH